MKTQILTLFLVLVASFVGYGQYYTQYFDGADTTIWAAILVDIDTTAANIWQIGPPQKVIFDSAVTLPNALVTDTMDPYPVNNVSIAEGRVLNQWGPYGILAIQWMQKLDMDYNQDGGIVEFSVDSGQTWQNAFNNPYVYNYYGYDPSNVGVASGEQAFTGTDSTWKDIWLCFDLSWMSWNDDTIRFRYTFMSDSIDNQREGWIIDNLMAYPTAIHTVNKTEVEDYMKIHPNPSTGRINIETRKLNEYHIIEQIQLIDMKGRIIKEWGVSPTKFYIDISDQSAGLYFLKIKTNKQTETFRVVLQGD